MKQIVEKPKSQLSGKVSAKAVLRMRLLDMLKSKSFSAPPLKSRKMTSEPDKKDGKASPPLATRENKDNKEKEEK